MTGPQIDRRVSFGSVLNLLGLAVAVAVGWGVMSERGEHTRAQTQKLRETLQREADNRRSGQVELEARVRALEAGQARSSEQYRSLIDVMTRLDSRLERIEQRLEGR